MSFVCIFYYRIMSSVIATALNIAAPKHPNKNQILDLLLLPDLIKYDNGSKFKAYFQAILLNGYNQRKVRKVIILGNKGNSNLSNMLAFYTYIIKQLLRKSYCLHLHVV